MSENGCVFCNEASGQEKLEAVYLVEGRMTHSIGGEPLEHVLLIPEDHVYSAEEMGRLPEGRAKDIDVTKFSYTSNANNGSDAGREIFFHLCAGVMGGRKVRLS